MIAESCFDSNHTIRIQEWPRRHATESRKEDASEDNKWFFNVQFSPRGQKWQKIISQLEASKYLVKRFGSDIRFQLESSCVWISISGWKPMLPGTQPARDRVYGGTRPPNFWTGGHNIFCPPQYFVIKSDVFVQISWLHYCWKCFPSITSWNKWEKWALSLDYL